MAISSPRTLILLTFSLLLTLTLTLAEIRFAEIRSDSRPIIPFDEFGFTHTGKLDLNVTLLSLRLHQNDQTTLPTNPKPNSNDLSLVGFFLSTRDSWYHVVDQLNQNDIVCALQSDLIKPVFSFDRLNNGGLTHFNVSLQISDPNLYTLVFANCIPNLHVSMDVHSSMYNLEGKSSLIRDYLSAGKSNLPSIYFNFALIYFALILIWVYTLFSKREVIYRIHYFMLAVLVLKGLNLLCEAEDKSYIKKTGSAHGWDVLFYIFSFLKGITLFTLIVLIGTGWSFLKPFLQDKEKKVLMIVIPLQVVANVAQVVIDETGPYGGESYAWMQVFLFVDIVCCCAVLFPIVWSIRNLREAATTDGKAAVNLMKLTLFRHYYVVVICYIYFTRVIVYGLETITNYRYQWTSVVAGELGTLAFYLFTGYNFRPKSCNPYFAIDDEEEEAAAEMLKMEGDEFEL
ncbi:protein GPR107-like [Chenopodium quinoa]|uniref:protein GPR107-like n=1 Tax=Chenopodium quinoa TaxID=63459 RepID=UPI000B793169|nr:protein GPR107-like [Chenopodium quinoa]